MRLRRAPFSNPPPTRAALRAAKTRANRVWLGGGATLFSFGGNVAVTVDGKCGVAYVEEATEIVITPLGHLIVYIRGTIESAYAPGEWSSARYSK